MTPGARVAAAIEILDEIIAGSPAEAVLTRWARGHRFAGSKDRAAIRDHVFDALRRLRTAAARGGSMTGRGVMLGLLDLEGADIASLFNGIGYSPAQLTQPEEQALTDMAEVSGAVFANLPDDIWPIWTDSLGPDSRRIAEVLQERAPITMRVNMGLASREAALKALRDAGIEAFENARSQTALTITDGSRKLKNSPAYLGGLVEPQDASSQAVVDLMELKPGRTVLDYCAGGGGKALAMAAKGAAVTAHDTNASRMKDIAVRAGRAQAAITVVKPGDLSCDQSFDLVVCDVPCSGSGTWRRTPDAKWRFTQEHLVELVRTQRDIFQTALNFLTRDGHLAYITCSVFNQENQSNVDWACEKFDLELVRSQQFLPDDLGDGLFVALLARKDGIKAT